MDSSPPTQSRQLLVAGVRGVSIVLHLFLIGKNLSTTLTARERVRRLLGRELPADLVDFYQERIAGIGEFSACVPRWNDHVGWRGSDGFVTELLHADAVPLFRDGCGNFFGLDLTSDVDTPAVYFFNHERGFEQPEGAVGSSLGAFLLLLADHDRACEEQWPFRWELKIDPDLNDCPRAPAMWVEG